jgi:hypothetical protein
MTDKVTQFPGKENELEKLNKTLRRELPHITEYWSLMAEIRMTSYRAHLEAGFTPEQALVLCK